MARARQSITLELGVRAPPGLGPVEWLPAVPQRNLSVGDEPELIDSAFCTF